MAELLDIERIQYPVGQGGFHACKIGLQEKTAEEYIYVYDCGSASRQEYVTRDINTFVGSLPKKKKINALFISHLDKDHISGIEELLKQVEVEKIFLPYLNKINAILHLLFITKTPGYKLIKAVLEPQKYFNEIAPTSEIILVDPADSKKPGDEPKESASKEGHRPHDDEGYVIRDIYSQRVGNDEQVHLDPRQRIKFEAEIKNIKKEPLDWILLPHVTPANSETICKFEKEFLSDPEINKLGIKKLSDINTKNAKKLFSDDNCIAAAKKIYHTIEKVLSGSSSNDHNLISMSLYSGPEDSHDTTFFFYITKQGISKTIPQIPFFLYPELRKVVGWIGTGDANLMDDQFLEDFWHTYDQFTKFVITLHLPHHGSKYSSNKELLDAKKFTYLKFGIFNARKNNKHHPSQAVLKNVLDAGIIPLQVSEEISSSIIEHIRQIS